MTVKTTTIVTALATGLAGAATAQTATDLVEFEDVRIAPFDATLEEVEDMDIYTATGDEVGEIEDVLFTRNGQAKAVAAEVGGFLGIGEKEVVISLDQITRQDNRVIIDMTEQEIEALPEWDD